MLLLALVSCSRKKGDKKERETPHNTTYNDHICFTSLAETTCSLSLWESK